MDRRRSSAMMKDFKQCSSCNGNEDALQKAIKETQRIKQENNDLRQNLKDLSKLLDETLEEKARSKQVPKAKTNQLQSVDVIEKQIKNAEKQVKNYKQTLEFYKKKAKGDYSIQRVNDLQIKLKDRQDLLKDLKKESKDLDTRKRQTENKLIKEQPEKQLNTVREEIMQLRNRIREQTKLKEQNQKNYEAQEKFIEDLQKRQAEICTELGIENKVIERPSEEQLFTKKDSYEYIDSDDDNKKKKVKMDYETFNKLKGNIDSINKIIDQGNKRHIEKIKLLERQIKKLEEEKITLKESLSVKDRYVSEAEQKLNQIKDTMNRQSYTEIGIKIKKEQAIRRVQTGNTVNSNQARSFRDVQELAYPDDMYIQEITVTSYNNYIIGLECVYKNRKGPEKQRITCFQSMTDVDDVKIQTMRLTSMEHLISVTGVYSTHIEYIKFITSRHQYIWGGSEKTNPQCKKFQLDIKKDDRPTSLFGTVDRPQRKKKKGVDTDAFLDQEYVLVSIGAELKKKDDISTKSDNMKINMMQAFLQKQIAQTGKERADEGVEEENEDQQNENEENNDNDNNNNVEETNGQDNEKQEDLQNLSPKNGEEGSQQENQQNDDDNDKVYL